MYSTHRSHWLSGYAYGEYFTTYSFNFTDNVSENNQSFQTEIHSCQKFNLSIFLNVHSNVLCMVETYDHDINSNIISENERLSDLNTCQNLDIFRPLLIMIS